MKRILVIKLSSLGDIAHALPAVRALKERTGAAIDWAVQPEYAPLLACCNDVARTIAFPRRNFARGFFVEERLAAQVGTNEAPPRRAARNVERTALSRADAGA